VSGVPALRANLINLVLPFRGSSLSGKSDAQLIKQDAPPRPMRVQRAGQTRLPADVVLITAAEWNAV
jgi:hypothetical protein